MEEKEKKPWRPPEAAHLPDPIAFAMQGFERFGLPKERLIPPLQTFDRVMQHSAFTENRWWENARQVTATSSAEQWRRVSIERARCLGEPWPDFDDIPVASITEDFSQKCQNATRMDKGQILMDYRLAKNHKRQIPILADLNVCDTQTIVEILEEGG